MHLRSGLVKIIKMNAETQYELNDMSEISTQTSGGSVEISTQTSKQNLEISIQTVEQNKNNATYVPLCEPNSGVNMDEHAKLGPSKNEETILQSNSNIEKDTILFNPDSGIDFLAWLRYFNELCDKHKLTEEYKLQNFSKFITGSALQIYINYCLSCKSFEGIIEIFKEKFYKPSNSFHSFNNVTFDGSKEKLFNYFHTKVELGRSLGLKTDLIVDGLTGGLPSNIKTLVMVKGPKTTTEWLNITSQLVEEIPVQTDKRQDHSPSFHNQQSHKFQTRPMAPMWRNTNFQGKINNPTQNWVGNRQTMPQPNFQSRNTRPNGPTRQPKVPSTMPKTHFSENFPPSPCWYCEAIGIRNAYHWGYNCINRGFNRPSMQMETPPPENPNPNQQQ